MKAHLAKGFWFCRPWGLVLVGAAWMAAAGPLWAQAASSATPTPAGSAASAAAAAWQGIEAESVRPTPPEQWKENRPSEEVVQAWLKQEGARLVALADRAHDFYTTFPKDPHVAAAKTKEYQALLMALRVSRDPAIEKRVDAAETERLSDPALPQQDRYAIRAAQVQRKARSREDLEKGARELLKEFPGEPQSYQMLLYAAKDAEPAHTRAVMEEIIKSNAPEEVKQAAKGALKMMDLVGKPLPLQFTALDGRPVDLQKMKGKVVLVDFWATWCGPCVAELPHVKAAYAKLRDKGFEIVGVSFDQDKAKLEEFLKAQEMTWPQYFDGKGWQNQFGQEFGIDSIPRMWLVDKKGVLRDMEGRQDLEPKVEKLLAEP